MTNERKSSVESSVFYIDKDDEEEMHGESPYPYSSVNLQYGILACLPHPDGEHYIVCPYRSDDFCTTMILKVHRESLATSAYAGSEHAGFRDGLSSHAMFRNPSGLAMNSSGGIIVLDSGNNAIRCISPCGGYVSTISGFLGAERYQDGDVMEAEFGFLHKLCVAPDDTIYVTEAQPNTDCFRIRKIKDGIVSTIFDTGLRVTYLFTPCGITCDDHGDLYITDGMYSTIFKLSADGTIHYFITASQYVERHRISYPDYDQPLLTIEDVPCLVDSVVTRDGRLIILCDDNTVFLLDPFTKSVEKVFDVPPTLRRNMLEVSDSRGCSNYVVLDINGDIILFLENPFRSVRIRNTCLQLPLYLQTVYNPKESKLEKLFLNASAYCSDISFKVGDTIIPAHSNILMVTSEVFSRMLSGLFREQTGSDAVITIEDTTAEAFTAMLRYIYTDRFHGVNVEVMFEILKLADRYLLKELATYCKKRIASKCSPSNAVSWYIWEPKRYDINSCFNQ